MDIHLCIFGKFDHSCYKIQTNLLALTLNATIHQTLIGH